MSAEPKPASGECLCGTDKACDLHGIPAKHDQPASGEWTAESVQELVDGHTDMFKAIADAHNAALRNAQPFLDDALKQLAAEKIKTDNATSNCMALSKLLFEEKTKNWIRAEDNPGFHRHE